MKKEIPWELIISDLKQDISDAGKKQLEEWLSAAENREVYEELRGVWEKVRAKVISYTPDLDFYWKELMQRMEKCEEAEQRQAEGQGTIRSFVGFLPFSALCGSLHSYSCFSFRFFIYRYKDWAAGNGTTNLFQLGRKIGSSLTRRIECMDSFGHFADLQYKLLFEKQKCTFEWRGLL